MNNQLNLRVIGKPKLSLNSREITDQFSLKALAMIFYLYLNRDHKVSRLELSNLLWENSDDQAAQYNLRYNIWTINKIFSNLSNGDKLIHSDRNYLKIDNFLLIHSDSQLLIDFDMRKSQELKENLLIIHNKCKGIFMEAFFLKKSNAFNDWIFYQRESYQKKYNMVLNQLKEIYINEKNYNEAIDIIEEMIKLNPYDENLYNTLIHVLVWKGDRSQAFKKYNHCINMLREELNIAPLESTKRLYKIIESAEGTNSFNDEKEQSVVEFEFICSKHLKIQYGFMGELIQKLLETPEIFKLIEKEMDIYEGLHYIQPTIFRNSGNTYQWLSADNFDQYIFKLSEELILKISEAKNIKMVIDNSVEMDEKSQCFMIFLLHQIQIKKSSLKIIFSNSYFKSLNELNYGNYEIVN